MFAAQTVRKKKVKKIYCGIKFFKLCNRNVAFGSAENSPLHAFFFQIFAFLYI